MLYNQLISYMRTIHNKRILKKLMRCSSTTTIKQPFPVLPDTFDETCLQISQGKAKAEILIDELNKLNRLCLAGGGEKGIAVHVTKNCKMMVRDRLSSLCDDENKDFLELSQLAGLGMEYGDIPSAGIISGIGKIHGRYCMVSANDASVKGGTYFPITVTKGLRANTVAEMNFLPSIYLVDSGGAYLPLQAESFPDKNHGGRSFRNEAIMSSLGIPQIAIVCGSCTAGGAYTPTMCEDAVIVKRIGTLFLGGPALVMAATGERITSEELGGASVHCSVSGCTDYFAETELDAFEVVRDVIATVNINPLESADGDSQDMPQDASILDALCGMEAITRPFLYGVIKKIVDGGRFREFKKQYGSNLITGYAFIDGKVVGVVANSGPLTYQDGLKGSHFAQICQQRQLPMLFLQNSGPSSAVDSFTSSLSREHLTATLKGRAAMIAAVSCTTVPKVTVNIGSCHGDDNYTMCGPSFSPNFVFSWPGTTVTHTLNPVAIPPSVTEESSPQVNKEEKKRRSPSAFSFQVGSALYQASRVLNDGIIKPSLTPKIVTQCFRIARQQGNVCLSKKEFPVFRI